MLTPKMKLLIKNKTCINDGVGMNVDGFKIDKSDTENLVGGKFDKELTFDDHIYDICKKAAGKTFVLVRVMSYMSIAKKCTLTKSFFTLQISYRSLVWMCDSLANNNKINRLHESCL